MPEREAAIHRARISRIAPTEYTTSGACRRRSDDRASGRAASAAGLASDRLTCAHSLAAALDEGAHIGRVDRLLNHAQRHRRWDRLGGMERLAGEEQLAGEAALL